jgi:hypothetical protein
LCNRGKISRDLPYGENHHIVPKCLGGSDESCNITRLTAKEHYIAHWLLYKMNINNWRVAHAFFWMSVCNNKNDRTVNSKSYERAKIAMAKSCSAKFKENNPMKTAESRKRQSEKMLGDNNPMRRFPERQHLANGKGTPPSIGCVWYNDGFKNKYFKIEEIVPDGWVSGMIHYADRGKWITNGVNISKLKNGEEMPYGYRYGKKRNLG